MMTVPTSASAIAYASTRQSGAKSNAMRPADPSSGGISCGIARVVQTANSAAAPQATIASASASTTKIRAMRVRDAPNDWRTAISRARTTARASIRLATFAQTMSSVSRDDREEREEPRPALRDEAVAGGGRGVREQLDRAVAHPALRIAREARGDRRQLGLRLGKRHIRSEATDGDHERCASIGQKRAPIAELRVRRKRQPDIVAF